MGLKKAKLLLVSDDALVSQAFGRGLEEAGYEVLLASRDEESLRMICAEPLPDLAILDMYMPGSSGIETVRHLSEKGLASLFLAAYDGGCVAQVAEAGALAYLVKPADAEQVIAAIEVAMRRAKDIRALREAENRLNNALDTGNLVNIVVGVLMERHRLSRQDAFELIRQKARSERRKVKDIARDVLDNWDILNNH
ncbi:MAG: ANTAR domain-containing response regulator [Pontibacterium sp.]